MQNVTESDDFNVAWMDQFTEASATFDRRMNQAVVDSGILRHIPRAALAKEGVPPGHMAGADWSCKQSSYIPTTFAVGKSAPLALTGAEHATTQGPGALRQSCRFCKPPDDVKTCALLAGRKIPLKPGAVALLQAARRRKVPTHVLSVSWSAEMLQGALRGRVPVSLRCACFGKHRQKQACCPVCGEVPVSIRSVHSSKRGLAAMQSAFVGTLHCAVGQQQCCRAPLEKGQLCLCTPLSASVSMALCKHRCLWHHSPALRLVCALG